MVKDDDDYGKVFLGIKVKMFVCLGCEKSKLILKIHDKLQLYV